MSSFLCILKLNKLQQLKKQQHNLRQCARKSKHYYIDIFLHLSLRCPFPNSDVPQNILKYWTVLEQNAGILIRGKGPEYGNPKS
jgi:hypothetical protein